MGKHGGNVGGEEVLALAEAHNERHVQARADEPIRLGGVHRGDGVGAVCLAQRHTYCIGDVALVGLFDEMGQRLRVGVRAELVAAIAQSITERLEVLDDAVVDDRDLARAVGVGMGIQVIRPAVRRPARVREANRRRGSGIDQRRSQVGQLAGALLDKHVAVARDERDAGRVIAAIFEPGEAFHQDGRRLTRPDVADDSAHLRAVPFPRALWRPRRAG